MKSKFLKKLFAILVVITLFIQNLSTVLATALSHDNGTTATLGISILGPNGWGYKVGNRIAYRTYLNNGTKDYENAIYCLDMTGKFPNETTDTDSSTTGNYENKGDFSNSSIENKDKIQIIATNMYISGQTDRDTWLRKVLIPKLRENDLAFEYLEDEDILELLNDETTGIRDDDIFFAQQLAIWHYTNGNTTEMQNLSLNYNNEENKDTFNGVGSFIDETTGITSRDRYIKLIYNYLIDSALEADTSYTTKTSLWEATSGNNMQPLLYVTKEPIEYDASLRKYITGYKSSTDTSYTEVSNRTPSNFSGVSEKVTEDDAFELNAGDYVKFKITIYNDGDNPLRVAAVKDYLPEGLEFVTYQSNTSGTFQSGSQTNFNNGWVYTSSDNSVTSAKAKDITLQPREKTDLELECKISSNATGYLENNAEILSITNVDGHIVTDKDNEKPYNEEHEDDDDNEMIKVKGSFDLELKKYVSSVNASTLSTSREDKTQAEKLENPVNVEVGDLVIFNIEVSNNGDQDGYVTEIKEHIPSGLGYIPEYSNVTTQWIMTGNTTTTIANLTANGANPGLAQSKEWSQGTLKDLESNDSVSWQNMKVLVGGDDVTITTTDLANTLISKKIGTTVTTKTVQIPCIVLSTEDLSANTIRNIAEISGHKDESGNTGDIDIDSKPNNYGSSDRKTENDNGFEDDEDFDVLKPADEDYDLALKKFVSAVEGTAISPSRLSNVDVTPLQNGEEDATYTIDKTPVGVKVNDIVTFTIRVYNEGNVDAYAEEITDTIPEGLQFIGYETTEDGDFESGNRTNYNNGWIMYDEDGNETTDVTKAVTVKTTYLSKGNSEDNVIKAFDGTTISYKEVRIEFKVLDTATEEIKNIAKITDDDGDDRDTDDTEDEDIVTPEIYDLALQKFVTEVDDSEIDGREPEITVNEDDEIVYTATNEPVTIFNGNIVIYTIRVYNEGNQDAYAAEIADDLPEGIEFLPDNEINQEYGWKMYDEEGNETEDIEEAVEIKTTYLSKDSEENEGDNLIKAFDKTQDVPTYENDEGETINNPDYRDIKVAFEVVESNVTDSDRTIINTATLTETTDEEGEPVEEEDEENNEDKEYIALNYFDLSLQKYVSKVIVTEDGQTKETETGYTGEENPEPVVKVEINKKKINSTTVKYVYTLKVTNEGEIEGYANEITDTIPAGMAFYEEDNTEYGWTIKEDGIVATDYLRKTLLEPGESATVQITLRWENSENNLGQKINTAEISEAENPYGADDVDSTPGNNVDGEDDQDTAIAMISITTGSAPMYIGIIITTISMFGIGGYLIKRYVL